MSTLKYRRSAFKPLPGRLEHMDIHISFYEDHVDTSNTLYITALENLPKIQLDAKNLKIRSVKQVCPEQRKMKYSYRRKANRLTLLPDSPVRRGQTFAVTIESTCEPTDNILEGIYRDTTPEGAPQQYMSQCQKSLPQKLN